MKNLAFLLLIVFSSCQKNESTVMVGKLDFKSGSLCRFVTCNGYEQKFFIDAPEIVKGKFYRIEYAQPCVKVISIKETNVTCK